MAIAFDSKVDVGSAGAGTNHTKSFTNTAGDIVIVGIIMQDTTTTLSNVQYGGVAMTATPQTPLNTGGGGGGNEQLAMYWLIGPATGANNITFTTSASITPQAGAVSYSGAKQTGQPDASTSTLSAGTTDLTLTMTTVADNSWLVGFWRNAYEVTTAGANTTYRTTTNLTLPIGDRGPVSPAGSYSIIAHDAISRDWSGIGMSIAPVPPAVTAFPRLALTGVGK